MLGGSARGDVAQFARAPTLRMVDLSCAVFLGSPGGVREFVDCSGFPIFG